MARLSSFLLGAILCFGGVLCHFNLPRIQRRSIGEVGAPLLLTPLIKAGKIQDAQASAAVTIEGFEDVKSYSGYLTVNEHYNSNLFFWFFPSQNDPRNDPVLLWLQGGPGASGMFGLFVENGPFFTTDGVNLQRREYSWTRNHSVIYVDNPVGTGFSFTDGGYAENQTRVGKELYKGLQQFFALFPDLRKNDFFITGESYAGKYGPAIAHAILKNNPTADMKINLKGISLGNPLVDPVHQFKFGEYLYEAGLIDIRMRKIFLEQQDKARLHIRNSQYSEANKIFSYLINTNEVPSLFENLTGITDTYNYLTDSTNPANEYYSAGVKFLQSDAMRKAIHVGNTTFGDPEVRRILDVDMMKSVAHWVNELLDHYRILFYGGQLDVMVPYTPMLEMLQKFKFSGAGEYKDAARTKLVHNGTIYGYLKRGGNLYDVFVRGAGHMVPFDKPAQTYDLISKFIRNQLK